jgi:hypothetical protein
VDASLIRLVWRRAGDRCEYCQVPQVGDYDPFEVDHIIARKHFGPTAAGNLALACLHCNAYKGANIAGRDPKTRKLTPLFNPRRHKWERHFRWRGGTLLGRTAIGRVTIAVLNMNDPFRVELREQLIEEGLLPPA